MPIDLKKHVAVLRAQSEYVCELSSGLCTNLRKLEQLLLEHQDNTPVDTHTFMEGFAESRRLLAQEAETLCQRLQAFVESTKADYDSPRAKRTE